MPINGPFTPDLLATTTGTGQFYAAADSSGVYYTDNGELHIVASGTDTDEQKSFGNVTSVALAKGDASVTTISAAENTPIDLVLDPPWVEWLDVPWFNTADANSSLVR
jgi:hypothetical protein